MIAKIDLRNKLNESKKPKKRKKLNEFDSSNKPFSGKDETHVSKEIQLGDPVMYKNMKGYITGVLEGNVIVQVQGSTYYCAPDSKDLVPLSKKPESLRPPFTFDEKTQKVLFEQYVKCGIFMNNIPVKTNDCYVKYSEWKSAGLNENVNVMVEGRNTVMERHQVKIFENVNEFANSENYVEGVIVDEETGEAQESVLINAQDYTQAVADADMVRVVRGTSEEDVRNDTLPKALLKTLSV